MVVLATPVPRTSGVLSLVVCPSLTVPVYALTLSTTSVIAGTAGGVVSGATIWPSAPVFPARSVAVTVSSSPFCFGVVRVREKLPVSSTTPVPITVSPSRTVMVLPASPWPVRVLPLLSTVKLPGAPGAIVSTVIDVTGDLALRLPAVSVAVAVKLCTPSMRAVVVCARVHWPSALAIVSPTRVSPS